MGIYAMYFCTEHPEWTTESLTEVQAHLMNHTLEESRKEQDVRNQSED